MQRITPSTTFYSTKPCVSCRNSLECATFFQIRNVSSKPDAAVWVIQLYSVVFLDRFVAKSAGTKMTTRRRSNNSEKPPERRSRSPHRNLPSIPRLWIFMFFEEADLGCSASCSGICEMSVRPAIFAKKTSYMRVIYGSSTQSLWSNRTCYLHGW